MNAPREPQHDAIHKPSARPWHERRLWELTPVRDAFWGAVVITVFVFVIWAGFALRAIFTPVLIALALAYLFHPVITACHKRWSMPRPVTISLIIFIVLAVTASFSIWIGPKVKDEVVKLAKASPGYATQIAEKAGFKLDDQALEPLRELGNNPEKFLIDKAAVLVQGTGRALGIIGDLLGMLGTVTLLAITVALVPIYFFFFAWSFGPLVEYFNQYIPDTHRKRTLEIIHRMDRIVATYFRSRVIIAIAMGIMFSIGWQLADVPYALLLGMGSGLLSLIPYACSIGWPLAVLLKWLSVTSGAEAPGFEFMDVVGWPSVVYLAVQGIESWILTPLIAGKSLDLSPVTVLIVVFIGGSVGGLYGLLLCIPLAACIKVLLAELVLPRVRKWAASH